MTTSPAPRGTAPRRRSSRGVLDSPWLAAALAVLVVALAAAVLVVPGLANPGATTVPGTSSGPSGSPGGPTAEPTFARPTPSPAPSFTSYTVKPGDSLVSIATQFRTTPRSIAWWNRGAYPSLDPESGTYEPNRIEAGWVLMIIPGVVVDENNPPTPSPGPSDSPFPTQGPSAAPTAAATARPTLGPSKPPTAAPATVVSHGSRSSGRIALTFDMGGRLDPAVDIVHWLIDHGVHATLFPTGKSGTTTSQGLAAMQLAATRPDLFDFANHSWDHPDFRTLTVSQMADQLVRTEQALVPIIGTTKPWFRPPYGALNDAVRAGVGAAGWRYAVMWDVDTIDWRAEADGGPTAAGIVAKIAANAQGGSIVLMHLGGWHTLEALPGILDSVAAKGLQPVTLSTLLGV